MVSHAEQATTPDGEAVAWRIRLADQGLGTSTDFEAWLAHSPRNAAAWAEVDRLWTGLELARGSAEVALLRTSAAERLARRPAHQMMLRRLAIAASVALIVGGAGGAVPHFQGQSIATPWDERLVVRLSDGTLMTLDASTRVRVRMLATERMVVLLGGQARFDVAHDQQRPFRVRAGDATITALGTSFTVDRGPEEVAVTLLQGQVAVTDAPPVWRLDHQLRRAPPAVLRAGQRLTLAKAGVEAPRRIEGISPEQATAWQAGTLVFDNESLGSAAERVSRYSARPITIDDPNAAAIRMSGVFKVGDTAAFVEALTAYYPLTSVVDADGTVSLRRRGEKFP